jgi:hypothetical protein
MPFTNLRGKRETPSARGELYKSRVLEYLRSRGAVPERDSAIEGSFPDLVMYSVEGTKLCIECKNQELSVDETEFIVPLCAYAKTYLSTAEPDRFKIIYCVRSVKNVARARRIFDDLDEETLEGYRLRCSEVIRAVTLKGRRPDLVTPSSIPTAEWTAFIADCELIQADFLHLEQAVRQRGLSVSPADALSVLVRPEDYPSFLKASASPDPKEETLVANYFPAVATPRFVRPDFSPNPNTPTMARGNVFYRFTDEEAHGRILALDGSELPVGSEAVSDWIADPDKRNWLLELVSKCLFKFCEGRGLLRIPDSELHYFPAESHELRQVTVATPRGKKNWPVVRRYVTAEGATNFYAHVAASLRLRRIGSAPVLVISNTWVFTEDGKTPVSSPRRSSLIRRWRRFDRNDTRLQRTLYWFAFLSGGKPTLEVPTSAGPVTFSSAIGPPPLLGGIAHDQKPLEAILGGTPEIPDAKQVRERFVESRIEIGPEETDGDGGDEPS